MALGLTTPWHFSSHFKNGLYKNYMPLIFSAMLFKSSCIDFEVVVFLGGLGPGWWFGFLKNRLVKRDCYLGLALGSQTTGPQTPKPNHLLFCWLCWDFFNRRFIGVWFQQAKCCQDSPSIQCQIDIQLYIYMYTGLLREQLYTCFGRLKLPQQQRFLLEGVHFGVYPIIKISNEFPQNQAGRILG